MWLWLSRNMGPGAAIQSKFYRRWWLLNCHIGLKLYLETLGRPRRNKRYANALRCHVIQLHLTSLTVCSTVTPYKPYGLQYSYTLQALRSAIQLHLTSLTLCSTVTPDKPYALQYSYTLQSLRSAVQLHLTSLTLCSTVTSYKPNALQYSYTLQALRSAV